jgi:prevent-host-death family protein
MQIVNIHNAKTHFSKLVDAVSEGEEILIAKAGKPVAKLQKILMHLYLTIFLLILREINAFIAGYSCLSLVCE